MYTHEEYENLKEKYGPYSSWAIWSTHNQKDTSIIDNNLKELNTRHVFIGLNISRILNDAPWSNFHGGKHDRKLNKACNSTSLKGSYLTDIFKGIPISKSDELEKYVSEQSSNLNFIKKHVDFFVKEMSDIKVNENTVFVVLGVETSFLSKYFNSYFNNRYKNIVNYRHYASRGTDEKWVSGLWGKLGINV